MDVGGMHADPGGRVVLVPFARDRPEQGVTFELSRGRHLLALDRRVDARLQETRGVLALQPRGTQRKLGIGAKHQPFFLAAKPVLPSPRAMPRGVTCR